MRPAPRMIAAAGAAVLLATGTASNGEVVPAPPPAPSSPPSATGYSATGTWQLLALTNQRRRALGLRPLTVDPRLAAAARAWTERMAARGSLAHNEALFSVGSHRALAMTGLGENVGWNFSVPAQHDAFVRSAPHRGNLQRASFRVAGFAVVRGADGRIWSTEDFGTPAP